ncbi:cyclodeaminase/cyclohydrolase family protein [Clostridium cylindrosporum]|uniref:Methenyltetrahydrofolate cyclohydrolase FchA n=1 Tax=Clostridium cylindrosporum DSM 605 TaxID=1121307 RepID=A0A0J8G310_CLOCY|nr:cyclodeaminase/cyclohydrolase family protein [Clostridium cylindrosporum]KMT22086.1 methenyltetrahydrofolate cyclohydrolase FchA [Clostridium cylindrosporum DSM 605]
MSGKLADLSIKGFLEATASDAPVPGGGSIAALSASISAALVEMVAGLTIGKKGYESAEAEMKDLQGIAAKATQDFVTAIDKDADSFDLFMKAMKMPKETDEEKAARSAAMQSAIVEAAEVPLSVAQAAFDFMKYTEAVVVKGNQNAVTDGAVAAMMARTAVISALYNVKINLGSIKDEAKVAELSAKVKEIESKVNEVEASILSKVNL